MSLVSRRACDFASDGDAIDQISTSQWPTEQSKCADAADTNM
jgi:hypothetical protein